MQSRIIKFRAWDKTEKVMCVVDVINFNKGAFLLGNSPTADEVYEKMYTVGPKEGHFVFFEDLVLMQFTGLRDKNGKEIYEGDTVKYAVKKRLCPVCSAKDIGNDIELKSIGSFCPGCGTKSEYGDFITVAEVVYSKAAFGYKKVVDEDHYQFWPVYANEFYIEWVEVIGNVYEHPELIENTPAEPQMKTR